MNWKYFGKVHGLLYRISGGRLGANMGGLKIVLVEMTGRKTGKKRTVPIVCYPYKDSVVISASNSGMERHPAWYFNLKANPNCKARLGQDLFDATAVELSREESAKLLPEIFDINPHQREYRETTSREIPLVWLQRGHS